MKKSTPKKPNVVIGSAQKGQAWRYVTELIEGGHLTEAATVTCYVLGSSVQATERGHRHEWDQRVTIIPMTYETFIRRAEKRMLGLRKKLTEAPFLKAHGLDGKAFVEPPAPTELDLRPGG